MTDLESYYVSYEHIIGRIDPVGARITRHDPPSSTVVCGADHIVRNLDIGVVGRQGGRIR